VANTTLDERKRKPKKKKKKKKEGDMAATES
jgi:hypothetical protein